MEPRLCVYPSIPSSVVLTALWVLRMLPVLQRLGDAYGLVVDFSTREAIFSGGWSLGVYMCVFELRSAIYSADFFVFFKKKLFSSVLLRGFIPMISLGYAHAFGEDAALEAVKDIQSGHPASIL